MRKSIISSLVAAVVAIANDRLVAAGVVAHDRLRRNSMREHLGNWHEPMFAIEEPCHACTSTRGGTTGRFTAGSSRLTNLLGNILNVVSQLMQQSPKRSLQQAYAYSPAYAAIARFAAPKG
jgi:hypothetical protein